MARPLLQKVWKKCGNALAFGRLLAFVVGMALFLPKLLCLLSRTDGGVFLNATHIRLDLNGASRKRDYSSLSS